MLTLRLLALAAGVLTFFAPAFTDGPRRLNSSSELRVSAALLAAAPDPQAEPKPPQHMTAYHGASGVWRIAEHTIDLAAADARFDETLADGALADIKRALFEQVWALLGGARPSAGARDHDFSALAQHLRAAMERERVGVNAQDELLAQLRQAPLTR